MILKELMTQPVETIAADTTIRQAADKMATLDVGVLPVTEDGGGKGVAGIVTDRDIVVRGIARNHNPDTAMVREIMTTDVQSVSSETDVQEAADLMRKKQIRRLIVEDGGKLSGIVSLGDLAVRTEDDSTTADALEGVSQPPK